MKHKGCYFSENSMKPQCRALWNRAENAEALLGELLSVAQGLHVSLCVPQIYPGDEVRLTDQLEQAGKVIRQTYAFVGKEFPG